VVTGRVSARWGCIGATTMSDWLILVIIVFGLFTVFAAFIRYLEYKTKQTEIKHGVYDDE